MNYSSINNRIKKIMVLCLLVNLFSIQGFTNIRDKENSKNIYTINTFPNHISETLKTDKGNLNFKMTDIFKNCDNHLENCIDTNFNSKLTEVEPSKVMESARKDMLTLPDSVKINLIKSLKGLGPTPLYAEVQNVVTKNLSSVACADCTMVVILGVLYVGLVATTIWLKNGEECKSYFQGDNLAIFGCLFNPPFPEAAERSSHYYEEVD